MFKARIFDRVLLALLMVIIIATMVVGLLVYWDYLPGVKTFLQGLFAVSVGTRILYSGILAVILIIAVRLLIAPNKKPSPSILVKGADDGDVRVTVAALTAITKQYAIQVEGIRDVVARFVQQEEGVDVHTRLVMAYGVAIPEATQSFKDGVRDHLERMTGLRINRVFVTVEAEPVNKSTARVR